MSNVYDHPTVWNIEPSQAGNSNFQQSLYCRKEPSYSGNNFYKKRPHGPKHKTRFQKKSLTSKKAHIVRKTHDKLVKALREHKVRHVKKVFGKGLVRVCCRTYDQLANIVATMRKIAPLIKEVGMPLQCGINMKSIVMFIKPIDTGDQLSLKIENLFKQNISGYNVRLMDIEEKVPEKITMPETIEKPGEALSVHEPFKEITPLPRRVEESKKEKVKIQEKLKLYEVGLDLFIIALLMYGIVNVFS